MGNSTTELTPSARASLTALNRPVFQPKRDTPGIESIGMSSSPSWMKTGRSRLAGVRIVSVMAFRMVGERRLRRGREGRSCDCDCVCVGSGLKKKERGERKGGFARLAFFSASLFLFVPSLIPLLVFSFFVKNSHLRRDNGGARRDVGLCV